MAVRRPTAACRAMLVRRAMAVRRRMAARSSDGGAVDPNNIFVPVCGCGSSSDSAALLALLALVFVWRRNYCRASNTPRSCWRRRVNEPKPSCVLRWNENGTTPKKSIARSNGSRR